MPRFWRRYLDGNPEYLVRNYWWAYLSPAGVWFFSHHTIINLILFGQYRTILSALTARLGSTPCRRMLQLTCAYGDLTPTLADLTEELHLNDVAAIQLRLARSALSKRSRTAQMARMNAESLAYAADSFDTLIIFFLLHELPAAARQRALEEALRVLKPNGRLLLAEYGVNRGIHPLHRIPPLRWAMERLEPFLGDFWRSNLHSQLQECAARQNKTLRLVGETAVFGGFYRVMEYRA
jgi:ubiquinone/menaquinone biosynthesis C-methylase UbiE